jgi:hypothetical protein
MTNQIARRQLLALSILLAALLAPPAVFGADDMVVVRGIVVDGDEQPVVGFQVVVRLVESAEVFFSSPTRENGEYAVPVPTGQRCEIVALISPGYERVPLPEPILFGSAPGARRDVVVDLSSLSWTDHEYEYFDGGDRLFLSYVEDTSMVRRYRFEAQLDYASLDYGDSIASRMIVAAQVPQIPRIEFGGRFGYAGISGSDGFSDGNGATDLDLWAKFHLGNRWLRNADFSFGGLVTLPTGSEENGQSFDALRSQLFFAMRQRFSGFILAARVGAWFNENGTLGPVTLEGQTAPALSVGVIFPFRERLVIIGEASFEGERFSGAGDDARLLGGVNWKPLPWGSFRLALSGGLTDGAPDLQFLGAWAIDF